MRLARSSFFVLTVFLFFAGAFSASAQTAAPTMTAPKAVLLASVNIQHARIILQKGNVFTIAFDLANGVGMQNDVKYAVGLVASSSKGQVVVDQKVYDDNLTLPENSLTHKDITYTAPASAGGHFTLVLLSSNSSGLPLGAAALGYVTLTAQEGILIQPSSCYLTVAGEKGSPKYSLIQGVDIEKSEMLQLTCAVQNTSKTTITATPTYQTHIGTIYGGVVDAAGADTTPVAFAPGATKTITFTLPLATTPQSYSIAVSLQSDTPSNALEVRYVLDGPSAVIANLQLDRDQYERGDTATLSFLWSDFTPGPRHGTKSLATNYSVSLTNGSGQSCAAPLTNASLAQVPGMVHVPVAVVASCRDPHASLTLTDSAGAVLAQKEIALASTRAAGPSNMLWYAAALLVVLVIVIFYFSRGRTPILQK